METKDFEKLIQEAPQRADSEKIEMIAETEQPERVAADEAETPTEPNAVKMSVGQFGATVAGIYCTVSDFVYKKIKKTETAPAWTETDKEALNSAITPVLEQYSITVSPITNLLVTLAVFETMRYSQKPQLNIDSGE